MTEQNFEAMRRAMVESQLRTTGVSDPRVIAAMAETPRERFVPAERRALAYTDRPVTLGEGRALNPPEATGRLLTAADVRPADHVLIVGAATGYTAALLARLAGHVAALEEDPALLAQARVPVQPGDTPDTLAARVLVREHRLLPACVRAIASGRLSLDGDAPRFEGIPLTAPLHLHETTGELVR